MRARHSNLLNTRGLGYLYIYCADTSGIEQEDSGFVSVSTLFTRKLETADSHSRGRRSRSEEGKLDVRELVSAIASGLFSRAGTLWVAGSWYTPDKGWKSLIRYLSAYNFISSDSKASQSFSRDLLHALQSLWCRCARLAVGAER